jgi:hypothetical protein
LTRQIRNNYAAYKPLGDGCIRLLSIIPCRLAHKDCIHLPLCDSCNSEVEPEYFHCSLCNNGDYDICSKCVSEKIFCQLEEHWLWKRLVKDGKLCNGTADHIPPRKAGPVSALMFPDPVGDNDCDHIVCSLIDIPLRRMPRYTALSYVWGDLSDQRTIWVHHSNLDDVCHDMEGDKLDDTGGVS